MLELGKKFTANVLKYPSVISRSYSGSRVINEKHVAYVEQTEVYILHWTCAGLLYAHMYICQLQISCKAVSFLVSAFMN